MINRRIFVGFAAISAFAACSRSTDVTIPEGTTLIMVRHSDREGVQLTQKGRARSEALVGALDGLPLDAIYAPSIQRNLETAAPLAAARGIDIQQTNAFDPTSAFLEILSDSAGQTIIWVGNQDNIAPIWRSLNLEGPPPLEYGDLFIVEAVPSAMPTVTRLQFGPD